MEVKGNALYQSASQVINIVNLEDKNELVFFVGLKPRIDNDIEF